MKTIEGVNLADELKLVRAQQFEAQKEKLRIKIANIIGKHSEAVGSVTKLEKDLEKARGAMKRHQDLLIKLEAGDFSAIEDDKPQGQKLEAQPE